MPAPPPAWASWEDIMREALHEAANAAAVDEIPVGAVVLDPAGNIIGRGHNRPVAANDPTSHAEIVAMRNAADTIGNYRLAGCFLAATLEPCLMCVGAIVHARIRGVVFGAHDPKAGAVSSCLEGFELPMHNHAVWHAGGFLEPECSAQLRAFFAARRQG